MSRTEQIQPHPCFSRCERKATLERVSITRNEKIHHSCYLLARGNPEQESCRGASEKQVETWLRSRERPVASEWWRTEKQEQIEFRRRREQEAVHIEDLAKQQVAEEELEAKLILDEQRRALIERASYECRLLEETAESAAQNLRTQLRQQDFELYGKESRM